jgi:hypothetical protein
MILLHTVVPTRPSPTTDISEMMNEAVVAMDADIKTFFSCGVRDRVVREVMGMD